MSPVSSSFPPVRTRRSAEAHRSFRPRGGSFCGGVVVVVVGGWLLVCSGSFESRGCSSRVRPPHATTAVFEARKRRNRTAERAGEDTSKVIARVGDRRESRRTECRCPSALYDRRSAPSRAPSNQYLSKIPRSVRRNNDRALHIPIPHWKVSVCSLSVGDGDCNRLPLRKIFLHV